MTDQALTAILSQIETLLRRGDEARWADRVSAWADDLARFEADSPTFQEIVRQVLAQYRGMGSFQDIVLQDQSGVRPEQAEFAQARSELFDALRQRLR